MFSVVAPPRHGGVQHLEHEVERSTRGVLRAELDVVGVLAGPGHAAAGLGQHLGLGHLEHVLHVLGAGGDEDVDAGLGRVAQRLPATVDVGDVRARQPGRWPAPRPGCPRCGQWPARPRSRPGWRRGSRPRCSRRRAGPAVRRSRASRRSRGRCPATARRRAAWCRRRRGGRDRSRRSVGRGQRRLSWSPFVPRSRSPGTRRQPNRKPPGPEAQGAARRARCGARRYVSSSSWVRRVSHIVGSMLAKLGLTVKGVHSQPWCRCSSDWFAR